MLPFPPPILPEPITVPNNAADAPYELRLRFIKKVGLLNLASLAVIAGVVYGVFHSQLFDIAVRFSTEALFLGTVFALVGLSATRRSPLFVQILIWVALVAFVCAPLGLLISQLHDAFPAFTETAGWSLLACWVGLVIYHLVCGRDFSFFGIFCLVFFAALLVTVTLTIVNKEVSFVEGLTLVLAEILFLFYWVYDMAMVLRRRTLKEPVQAALDHYRDLLNFVGFPVRVLRMRKRKGRVSA